MKLFAPVALPDGCYSNPDARSFTAQDVLGFIRENAEAQGTRSPYFYPSLPGYKPLLEVSDISRQRGGYVCEGRLIVVLDTTLVQVNADLSLTAIGTVPGISRCSFSHNQIPGGNEVLICNGTQGFIWNTVSGDFDQVTDDGFRGGLLSRFIGSRFLSLDPGRRIFQNSALADGSEWNSSEFYAGESSPDRIRSVEVINNEVVLLNENSIEHFAYTGTENALFENKGIAIGRGSAATHAACVLDNALFFLGNDGSAYEKRGYELRRISTHAIERTWAECTWHKAFAYAWEDRGHKVWYLTFPDGFTWGYDVATRTWHRRESYGMNRSRLAWVANWNGVWVGGEYNAGRIFTLDWAYPLEGADPLVRELGSGVLHRNGSRFRANGLRLNVEAGPTVEPVTVTPQALPEVPTDALPSGFLAVAEDGKTAFSEDGETWDLRTAPTANMLQRVACVNGTWLTASAADSKVYVSTDNGEAWTDYTLTPTCDSFNVLPIAFSPAVGVYIGRDQAHAYLADPDDLTAWTGVTVATGSSNMGGGAGNATRIVLGDYGGKDAWTTDGTFTQVSTAHNSGADIYQVIWDADNSVFVSVAHVTAGSDVCSSADGTASSWTGRHTYAGSSKTARSICPDGQGGYVLMGDADLLLTTPSLGGSWTTRTNPLTGASINDGDIHPDTGRIVIVGDSGKMAYSDDQGATWTAIVSPFSSDKTIFAIRYGVQP